MGLLLLTMTLCLAFCLNGLAAGDDPIEFTIAVTPDSLTEESKVAVSLRAANAGDETIEQVTLYDPDGNVVTSFGDGGAISLTAGDFRTWTGEWNVTAAQLDAGAVSYTLKYPIVDESGEAVSIISTATAPITFTGEKAELSVNRTITPEVVRSGGTASVMYELYNSGNVDLTDIRVKESISKTAQKVDSLAAGEKKTLTFTSKIGNADLKSGAEITYKIKGNTKTQTKTVEEAVIPLAKPNLKIALSSPAAGVNIGEAATLVITFTNEGNISYSNVSVSDAKKGEILTNLSIPAGSVVVKEKEFILTEKTEFKATATLPDNTGETKTVTTDPLTIGVFDPEKTLLLTLNLSCDHETIEKAPADVRFNLVVTNNSNVKAEKIAISHGATAITTIDALEPGESTTLVRDVRVSQAGKFCFTAQVKDAMNNTVTFDSNTLQLAYSAPTAAPTAVVKVTVAPPALVTPVPVEPVLAQAKNVILTVGAVLGILFGLGLILFLISSFVRLGKKNKSKAAYDHLDLSERRDYTEPADEYDADEENEEEKPIEDENREKVELPHEKLVKPLAEAAQEVKEATASGQTPEAETEDGFRVSRNAEETDAEPAKKNSDEQKSARRRAEKKATRTEDGEE